MNSDELRALQKPLKDRYRDDPDAAKWTLSATGTLDPANVACHIDGERKTEVGLHPATGGTDAFACSAEMLLESLIGCAGVTMCAVATAMNIPLRGGTVQAEGDLDFRGTLGVDKSAEVGLTEIRLSFELDTEADADQLATLLKLTERYCVVFRTLQQSPRTSATALVAND